ncbi:hypothetical protein FACS1894109_00730 [Spirochaetia bacterium]|nr:hypothetical protein FACS1894109_00730 [Spirochaetia bacterium]
MNAVLDVQLASVGQFITDDYRREISLENIRERLGYCTQRVLLIHGTVRDNIVLFDTHYSDGDILEALRLLDLQEWFQKFPKGLDTHLALGEGSLSSGEVQLITLARLALRKPDITRVSGNAGHLFEVLDDDIPAATFPAELLTEVTGYLVYTLIALSMLLAINWRLTLFIFIPMSIAIYGVQRLSERMKERRRINREAHDTASSFISDITDTVLAVKTSGAENAVLKQVDKVNGLRRAAVIRDAAVASMPKGILTDSGGRGDRLSGGQRQRLALARMLARGAAPFHKLFHIYHGEEDY